ncbi:MAG: helix-turn-helix domain-containing protein [Lachnospiraceae bacterium]|nr:helix-turn-helix domain-containing protein [Lachnospiraceae bacterium]
MDQEKTGRFIAEKRKEKGMTQKELAGQLGIGDKAVSKWECGRGMPDNSIMLPLCNLLGINVNELLMGESLSEHDYHESSEDIILTLMEEKESIKKKSKMNLLSCILMVLLTAILFFIIIMPIQVWHSWMYYVDPLTFLMDPILVLVMLLVTGNVKVFFRSFSLIRKEDVERNNLFSSLQAVKLAIISFLLGGGLFTLLDTIFILRTMTKEPQRGVSITLLTMLYGTLFALFLLPLKFKLESKMEEMHEKSDQSGTV